MPEMTASRQSAQRRQLGHRGRAARETTSGFEIAVKAAADMTTSYNRIGGTHASANDT
jgi:hypothetical protein